MIVTLMMMMFLFAIVNVYVNINMNVSFLIPGQNEQIYMYSLLYIFLVYKNGTVLFLVCAGADPSCLFCDSFNFCESVVVVVVVVGKKVEFLLLFSLFLDALKVVLEKERQRVRIRYDKIR